jgi:hypothetical protein
METRIALFQKKEIRKTIHADEWWFVITDVVAALTDTPDPADYLKKIRKRDPLMADAFKVGGQLVPPLALDFLTAGGPQKLLCWNTEGIFRLIQSIPSPKAEPFKRWLARVGYERMQEIEDPEIATKRTRALYRAKGYSDAWIERRMRSIAIRDELTDEWKKRGGGLCGKAVATLRTNRTPISRRSGNFRAENHGEKEEGMVEMTARDFSAAVQSATHFPRVAFWRQERLEPRA